MGRCCFICGRKREKHHNKKEKFFLHGFPKRLEIRYAWLEACDLKFDEVDDFNNLLICSFHFEKNCYVQEGSRQLKFGCVPSLNLPTSRQEATSSLTKNNSTVTPLNIRKMQQILSTKINSECSQQIYQSQHAADIDQEANEITSTTEEVDIDQEVDERTNTSEEVVTLIVYVDQELNEITNTTEEVDPFTVDVDQEVNEITNTTEEVDPFTVDVDQEVNEITNAIEEVDTFIVDIDQEINEITNTTEIDPFTVDDDQEVNQIINTTEEVDTLTNSPDQPQHKRRFGHPRFISEIDVFDLDSPKKAKRTLTFIKEAFKVKSRKIKQLQDSNRHLQKEVNCLQLLVKTLQDNGLSFEKPVHNVTVVVRS